MSSMDVVFVLYYFHAHWGLGWIVESKDARKVHHTCTHDKVRRTTPSRWGNTSGAGVLSRKQGLPIETGGEP